MQHLAPLIAEHGYWVTFVGALLEGETILALAGLAAQRGYLHWPALVLLGAIGGFVGDQIYFVIGRRGGARLLERFPRFRSRAARVAAMIERHPELAVIGVRFLYGLRTIGPAAIGMSGIAWWHFALLNAVGAAIWSVCWVGAGYLMGETVEMMLGDLRHVERVLFAAAVIVALAATIVLRWRRRNASRDSGDRQ